MVVIETRGKSVAGQKKVPVLAPVYVQKGLEVPVFENLK